EHVNLRSSQGSNLIFQPLAAAWPRHYAQATGTLNRNPEYSYFHCGSFTGDFCNMAAGVPDLRTAGFPTFSLLAATRAGDEMTPSLRGTAIALQEAAFSSERCLFLEACRRCYEDP